MRKFRKKDKRRRIYISLQRYKRRRTQMFIWIALFRGLYQDTKQPTKELWYDTFSAKKIYRAAMSLNRFKWLERTITFYDHNTVRVDFSKIGLPVWDRFWRNLKKMRGSITEIQNLLWWIKLWETFMFRIIVVLSLYERQTWKFWFFSSSISRCTRPICF